MNDKERLRNGLWKVACTSNDSNLSRCCSSSSCVGRHASRNLRVIAIGAGTPTSLEMRATARRICEWEGRDVNDGAAQM